MPTIKQEVELQLFWIDKETGEKLLLNNDDFIMFYELYNSEDVTFMEPPNVR